MRGRNPGARRGPTGLLLVAGLPPAFDPVGYRGRNVVERGFADVEQWRALATRYERTRCTNAAPP